MDAHRSLFDILGDALRGDMLPLDRFGDRARDMVDAIDHGRNRRS
jgi:hypothetical protein